MYKLKNYNEVVIDHILEDILKKYPDICKCEKCILDIKAIALNSMTPKYVVTDKGELFTKLSLELNNQEIVDETKYVVQAIEQVSKKPMH
jgi:competence protein ComFB